ncbi:hypothetical protein AO398_22000 [Methylobacterium sp. GXS13]|uniref:DUF6883 domain-containing protein n=1 Tax=Methylobacterium sp. GXS13 TaxID=1730094 RepID=UPI00071BB371|nr:DUF6883 domain-containing protein [Methylobacterium sp. GXS13]KST58268.1 hypothetical protein AO398_22000 [Methylobacterium sp. GXS13]
MADDPDDWTPDLAIAESKIHGYLLNPDHRKGGVLLACGFTQSGGDVLVFAFFRHPRPSQLVREFADVYGHQFDYERPLESPDGRNPLFRSVWQSKPGDPRRFFCTAYPL